ncbi:MAG: class I SAM-dependent methyltransferase [Desulfobacterales bacterium]|nr:class I SAM-dependent methyltransferase [Desulfobacterales bacterium]
MDNRKNIIKKICRCPFCHESLLWDEHGCTCSNCRKAFPYNNGKPCFNTQKSELTSEAVFHLSLFENETLTARLVRLVRKVVSSEYEPRNQLAEFLQQLDNKEIIIECGSGNRRLNDNVINIDLQPFEHTDIITDIVQLPFADKSVGVVVLDTVLEHVEDPQQCINEAHRVLRTGGKVVCITPFIFPYHAYPKHYWNFSEDGLEYLFRNFSNCTIETNMGPTSALINLIAEYFALALSNKNPISYIIFKGMALVPLFLFKYLDRLWYGSEKAKKIAMCLFTSAEK